MKAKLRRAVYLGMRGSGAIGLKRRMHARAGLGWSAVLVFHQVVEDTPTSGIAITTERFRDVLALLRSSYTVLSADQFVRHYEEKIPFTGREVLITFDDGYADNVELAAPILKEFDMPALFFLTAGYVGTERSFWWDEQRGVKSRLMTWDQARELSGMGFTVGCHTHSHPDLGREPIKSARRELWQARDLLQQQLGVGVDHFAYPFGGRENIRMDWLDMIQQTGFRSSFCGFGGLATTEYDRFWIPRMGAAHQSSVLDLRIEMDNAW